MRAAIAVVAVMASIAVGASAPLWTDGSDPEPTEPPRTAAPAAEAPQRSPLAQIRATAPTDAELRGALQERLLRLLVRCVELEGQDYCLQVGFVKDADDPALWEDLERRVRRAPSRTGDLGLGQRLAQLAAMNANRRAELERQEIESATGAARDDAQSSASVEPPDANVAGSHKILASSDARRQVESHWCGPATLQMIDGADDDGFDSQASWASDLGTTSQGTWIGSITQQINLKTAWDSRAGGYAVRDISGWTKQDYWAHVTRQLSAGAPYVEHPVLRNAYYPYLSTTGGYGGHFQVGRGWERLADGTRYIHIFEPFNEPDWTAYAVTTWGARRALLADVHAANLANQATIGT